MQTVAPSYPQQAPALLLRPFLLHTLFAEAKPSAFSRHHPARCPLPPLNRLYPLPLLSACQNRPHVFLFPPCCCLATCRSLCEKKKIGGSGWAPSLLCPQTLNFAESATLKATAASFYWQVFLFGKKKLLKVSRSRCSKVGLLHFASRKGCRNCYLKKIYIGRH